MERENLLPEPDEDVYRREERCCRAIKSVGKAIFMRLVVAALIVWAFTRTRLNAWMVGLMIFVIVIDLSALLPLVKELKNRLAERKTLLNEESYKGC